MKRALIILLMLILVIGMAACVRSKSPEQKLVPTEAGEAGQPPAGEGEDDVMKQLELFVTQTAIAAEGGNTGEALPTEGSTTEGETTLPEATEAPSEGQPLEPSATSEADVQPTTETVVEQPTAVPTQAPVVVVPTATPGIPTSHTIQTGESPYCIARRYNVDPGELMSINGLSSGLVFAGQVLKIPQSGKTFPPPRALVSHPATYTVSQGDNIYKIACYFGDVDPMAIAFANGLTAPYNLQVGQTLQIP